MMCTSYGVCLKMLIILVIKIMLLVEDIISEYVVRGRMSL